MKKQLFLTVTAIAMSALLTGSVGINVLLARRLGQYKAANANLRAERVLQVGEAVSGMHVMDLQSNPLLIPHGIQGKPTLLYVFTPSCVWCVANLDNIKHLTSQKREEYNIIGLSLAAEGISRYVEEHHLDFPVYIAEKELATEYKLGGTPQTIVVSKAGKVEANWIGAYGNSLKPEIDKFFHVTLPGLGQLQ